MSINTCIHLFIKKNKIIIIFIFIKFYKKNMFIKLIIK